MPAAFHPLPVRHAIPEKRRLHLLIPDTSRAPEETIPLSRSLAHLVMEVLSRLLLPRAHAPHQHRSARAMDRTPSPHALAIAARSQSLAPTQATHSSRPKRRP